VSVFDRIIGQPDAVRLLQRFAPAPTNAYLFTGPGGNGKLETALAFAAALQCAAGGCGTCDRCRQVVAMTDPDLSINHRVGTAWSVDELHEVQRKALRRPLLGRYQIVVLTHVEEAVSCAPVLLKVLEEPPVATIFLLLADDIPESFDTIRSRCVEVPFRALRTDDLVAILVRDGATDIAARMVADASGGDLDRARLLLADAGVAHRMEMWRTIPDDLGQQSPASLAAAIMAQIAVALEPLRAAQATELEALRREAEMLGRRGVVNREEVERRHKREQRRYTTDDFLFGLAVLARTYRERLVGALEGMTEGDRRSRLDAANATRAVDEIGRSAEALRANAQPAFLLTTLLSTLATL
jgi:DNA polymerase III subunit delta'